MPDEYDMIDDFLDKIICGDAIDVLKQIPDNSIDVIITSPPYWKLRDYGEETCKIWDGYPNCEHEWGYEISKKIRGSFENANVGSNKKGFQPKELKQGQFCKKCNAWYGQLGLEPHPQMYINHLIQIFHELKRVLKPTGSFWLNIGDTYCGGGVGQKDTGKAVYTANEFRKTQFRDFDGKWLQPKQLMLIPSRVAIALQEDGWILRNDVIWRKLNPMPSSVEDRLNTTYEHLFHFVKNDKTILWRHRKTKEWTHKRPTDKSIVVCPLCKGKKKVIDNGYFGDIEIECPECNGNGKVWIWKGFDYYYDLDLIREEHSQAGIQRNKYGMRRHYLAPWRNFDAGEFLHPLGKNPGDVFDIPTEPFSEAHFAIFPMALIDKPLRATLPKDGIVLDPFGGRGTVGRWCRKNWGHYIIIDINPKYCEMADLFIKGQKKSGYKKCRKLEAYYD